MRWPVELVLGVSGFLGALWLTLPHEERSSGAGAGAGAGVPPARSTSDAPLAPGRPEREVTSYTLRARLDPNTHRVAAEGTIAWTNTSTVEVKALYFHLYLNAFKNDRTLFLRSPFGAGRSGARAREYGYIDVKRLQAVELGNVDLWPGRARHSPNDPEDETDIEVPLPSAVQPGARLTLSVEFTAQLPQIVERTGYHERFHLVAQWFPKLARLERDGRFAHFPFHPQSEFYADFGRYDVTLDVPSEFIVGASGERVEERRTPGRHSSRYVADGVHDFAWTAWDEFIVREASIDGVRVRLLHPPQHDAVSERTERALAVALPDFSRRYGKYPYRVLTVVHPPSGAEGAGGMEYPTLITTGGPWYLPYTGVRALEAVTVHELGHQWFYGLLASNESRAPVLDEGLTSYAEQASLARWLGDGSAFEGLGLSISSTNLLRVASAARAGDEPIAQPAADFSSFRSLGALVYGRTAIVLETASRVFGRERLGRALQTYALRFRFAHPTVGDFLTTVREELGDAAGTFVERALVQRGRVNYVIREIDNAQEQAPAGFFERVSGRERVSRPPFGPPGYRARVTVYRHGDLELPVDVVLIAEDGARQRRHWDGRGPLRAFDYQGSTPLVRAIVDPEHKVLIDDDLFDNVTAVSPDGAPRAHERLAYLGSLLLGGILP